MTVIQLKDYSRQIDSGGRDQNYGTSPRNSSQRHQEGHRVESTMNAGHQSPSTSQDELQKLRTKDAVDEKIIKIW